MVCRFAWAAVFLCSVAANSEVPQTSLSVRKTGLLGCGPPNFRCLEVVNRTTPKPKPGEVIIKVAASSLNPDEITILKIPAVHYTPGIDVSGTVVDLGVGVTSLKVGDRVWTMFATGGMSEYTAHFAELTGVVPPELDLVDVGTLPTVGMTVLGALESAGAPWDAGRNVSVLMTSCTGGTGYVAVQLAKALGASRVICATSSTNLDFARSLGADVVVDYHESSVFDAVADGSVDVVLNNHDAPGNADKSMAKFRVPGGVYVTVVGASAKNPREGVEQIHYSLATPKEMASFVPKLDMLAGFLKDGRLRVIVDEYYDFDHVKEAFSAEAQGHVKTKIAVVPRLAASVV